MKQEMEVRRAPSRRREGGMGGASKLGRRTRYKKRARRGVRGRRGGQEGEGEKKHPGHCRRVEVGERKRRKDKREKVWME